MLDTEPGPVIEVTHRISDASAAVWDTSATKPECGLQPFISYAFLSALEDSGAVGPQTGWQPQHLILKTHTDGDILGCMPLYAKSHSKGEYVFDYGWAEAYQKAGGAYYPKLLSAVPFTPVPGARLLVTPGKHEKMARRLLASGGVQLCEELGLSSLHINFLTEEECDLVEGLGFLKRTDQQFHWFNKGYETFDDFLNQLSSRKRKTIRKERKIVHDSGLTFKHVSGDDITEEHWDSIFSFYMDTGTRKWGRPYLNRTFFSLLGERLKNNCVLFFAYDGARPVAGALNLFDSNCLYGRYWGASGFYPFLHFEICYYQSIDYAIAHKLARVEAGAQGDHKLSRGYLSMPTYSAHWLPDPGFREAVASYLDDETAYVELVRSELNKISPFRRGPLGGGNLDRGNDADGDPHGS